MVLFDNFLILFGKTNLLADWYLNYMLEDLESTYRIILNKPNSNLNLNSSLYLLSFRGLAFFITFYFFKFCIAYIFFFFTFKGIIHMFWTWTSLKETKKSESNHFFLFDLFLHPPQGPKGQHSICILPYFWLIQIITRY